MIHRRSFMSGLISLVAAPAIVRVSSIMPVRVMEPAGLRYRAIGVSDLTGGDTLTFDHINRMLEFAKLNRPQILTVSPAFKEMFDEAIRR